MGRGRKTSIGDRFTSTLGTVVEVVGKVKGKQKSIVKCLNDPTHFIANTGNLNNGTFKTPLCRTVYGIGYFGHGKYLCRDSSGVMTASYMTWANMLRRCYKEYASDPSCRTYSAEVASEWHNYQNFAEWYCTAIEKFEEFSIAPKLDKDLFSMGARGNLYSPDTCCILPNIINCALVELRDTNKNRHGVSIKRGKFLASVMYKGKQHYSSHLTEEGAVQDYCRMKSEFLRELAGEYMHVLDTKVYDKLINWEPRSLLEV